MTQMLTQVMTQVLTKVMSQVRTQEAGALDRTFTNSLN